MRRKVIFLFLILFISNYVFSEKMSCIRKEGFLRIIIPISAYQKTKQRILLIGDSITLDYYDTVKLELPDYAISLFATSACGCSDCYKKYLEFILSTTDFYLIHFNNSTLHCLNIKNDKFRKTLEFAIKLIKKYQPNATIILATATFTTDKDLNKKVVEKNRIIKGMALKYNLLIDDLFSVTNGRMDIHKDKFHFTHRGYELLGKAVSKSIKSCIEKKKIEK